MALRFFDLCFKQGVIDACDHGDDIDAKAFLLERKEDWSFGLLPIEGPIEWPTFCHELYWVARKHGMKTMAESYLFRIRTKNYIWCLLPYCMRFYLMGVEEWLRYPSPVGIEVFKREKKTHWDPSSPIKKITKPDLFSYLHGFEFEYRKLDPEIAPVSETSMSNFIKALYDLTRPYLKDEREDF